MKTLLAFSVLSVLASLAAGVPRHAARPVDDPAIRHLIGQPWWKSVYDGQMDAIRKSNGRFDFVMIGDSITRNWSVEKGASYFGGERCLGKAVSDELFAKYRWLNAGIGGDGTAQVLWRCRNGILDGYETRLISLMVGTNDRTDSAETVADGIRKIVAVIRRKQPKAKLLLCPILPRFVREDDPGDMNAKNEKTNSIIRRLCDGKKIIWFDWRTGLYKDGTLDKSLWFDREHPGDGGYRVWAKALLPHVSKGTP